VKINGKQYYLRRVVDQDGEVIDVYLQARCDGIVAERLQAVATETISAGFISLIGRFPIQGNT
jgi:transposase-like protein